MHSSLFLTKLSNSSPPGDNPLQANAPWWGPTTCWMPSNVRAEGGDWNWQSHKPLCKLDEFVDVAENLLTARITAHLINVFNNPLQRRWLFADFSWLLVLVLLITIEKGNDTLLKLELRHSNRGLNHILKQTHYVFLHFVRRRDLIPHH